MGYKDKVPMLGCENAWIAAGALIAAVRNEGTISLTDEQIVEALNRTKRQAVGGYCGLTGVCGIAPAIGACFSVILGAGCPKDRETAVTMRVVAQIVNAIARETGPCCCKNFVRTALTEAVGMAAEYLEISLPKQAKGEIICTDARRHPHGCRKEKCSYYNNEFETGGDGGMLDSYDKFHSTVYGQEGVLGRKTKHLIALAASLAAGCEP